MKKQKGITLIALVITIIVLLILASISIAILTGENGILKKANEAKERTERETIIEQAKLAIIEYETENEGKITDEKAYEIIAKYDKNYKENEEFIFQTEDEEEYILTDKGYKIFVKEIWNKVSLQKIHFTLEGVEYTCSANAVWGDDEIKHFLVGSNLA